METLVRIIHNLYTKLVSWIKKTMNSLGLFSSLNTSNGAPPPPLTQKYLTILGNNTTSSALYDSTLNTFSSGPTLSTIIGTGSLSFLVSSGIQSGNFVVIDGGSTGGTQIFNKTTQTFSVGASLPNATVTGGARAFLIPSGTYAGYTLIIYGNTGTTDTALYNPSTDTFSAGPSLLSNTAAGCNVFNINSGPQAGNIMVISGNNTDVTQIYDCTTSTFITGPLLTSTAAGTEKRVQCFSIPLGQFVTGIGSNACNIYTESSNSFSAGPTLPLTPSAIGGFVFPITSGSLSGQTMVPRPTNGAITMWPYDPTGNSFGTAITGSSITWNRGTHSFSIVDGAQNGKQMIIASTVQLFNPSANTLAVGPTLPAVSGNGSHTIKYLV
jgi:hypothetical protein